MCMSVNVVCGVCCIVKEPGPKTKALGSLFFLGVVGVGRRISGLTKKWGYSKIGDMYDD